ncbi:CdaR family protein [Paenibacillus sp. sgz302251]|uniref:CdaR family protein n=1 Tax=Paenibacillus sp. sgz302251 TaxID=3414493 RepID=UPI003C7B474F
MDKWISHPTSLKIFSVIIGLLLWAVVHIDPNSTPQSATSNFDNKIIEASVITAEGLDTEKYVLTAMEPSVVRLDVQGRLTDLKRASSDDDYIVKVDLKNVKPGIQELPLTYSLPRGIQLIQMSPSTVTVQIEEIVTKTFELQVATQGTPAEGFIVGAPVVAEPASGIKVTLPKDDMDRVGVVSAEVNIDGADKTVVNKKANVVVYDKDGLEMTNAIISPATAHVEVKVTPPFKTVPLQVRYSGSLPDGFSLVSIKPEMSEVTIYGDQQTLDGIQVYDGVVLDLSKVMESGSIQVKTQLVDGIKSIEPAEVTLDVVIAPDTIRTFTDLPVTVEGESSGLTAVFRIPSSGKLDLTVSGAQAVISDVQAGEIKLLANVEGLGEGVHEVPVQVDVPDYVQTVLAEGQTLTVTIELVSNTAANTEMPESEEAGTTPTEPSSSPDPGPGGGSGSNASAGGNSTGNSSNPAA